MAFQRPGVVVEEIATPNFSGTVEGESAGALVGEHHRGPTGPTLVTSWSGFKQKFGGFTSDLSYAAWLFFHNSGSRLWVARPSGTGGALATRSLVDNSAVATIRVDALNIGAWANDVYVEVDTNGVAAGNFNLTVFEGGTSAGLAVERWGDLSMDASASRYFESVVNHPTAGSTFIALVDQNSITAAPDNAPTVTAPVVLAGGVDATVTATDITDALPLLDSVTEPLAINIPGGSTVTTGDAAVNYAAGRGDCFAVIDPAPTDSVADILATAGSLSNSSYGALYYPAVNFADPGSSAAGAVKLLGPGGAILGKFAEVDNTRGVHKAPAGLDVSLNAASSLPVRLTPTELASLNSANVNAIRSVPGRGAVVMGARTLSNDLSTRYIPVRRTLNSIKHSVSELTQFAVFEPNDEALWSSLSAQVGRYLREVWQSGGLRGRTAEEAFYVKCDADLNTEAVVASGQVIIEVGVATQRPAEFIVIRIGQWQGGQNSDEV